ncbi:MAG: uracil permease, partial [Oligoflexia bacterium]|nr:uracil permease [Oligoflexia bacterium]
LVLGGFIVVGFIFLLVALLVATVGTTWIDILLPPAAMGPIIALIGLELAQVAASMAGYIGESGTKEVIVSSVTLLFIMFGSIFFRGFFAIIPILLGIIIGYILSLALGLVDLAPVAAAPFFKWPTFYKPQFEWNAILIIAPAALVVISEHIGHLIVTGHIVERDLAKDPGLYRSLAGNGVSTILSGLCGSVPTTTYGENIGVMAVTRVYSVWVIGGAAILSVVLAFSGTLSTLIQTIPTPVMGGVCMLLFGIIAASGIRMLVESKVDYSMPQNLMVTSITFTVGVSGMAVKLGSVPLKGMCLATVVAMILNLFLYLFRKI